MDVTAEHEISGVLTVGTGKVGQRGISCRGLDFLIRLKRLRSCPRRQPAIRHYRAGMQ